MTLSNLKFKAPLAGAILLATMLSVPSSAYNISLKGRMHERMTFKAEECLALANGALPTKCDIGEPGGKLKGKWKSPLAKATRWSDDPTDQAGLRGAPKFLYNMAFGGCEKALDAVSDQRGSQPFAGLLCNSHYGDFQFMHAMSVEPSEGRQETIDNMLAWADQTYGVATGAIGRDAKYCEHFSKGSTIDGAMAPDDFPFCEGTEKAPGWRVHTLFSLRCKNPFSSVTCTEYVGDSGEVMARRNATGALLHLVQDSYSQAHAVRGVKREGKGFDARIDCSPIISFYNYNEQIAEGAKHSDADKRPKFSASCFENGSIDDPVTASAILLWHIQQNSEPAVIRAYLSERVFGPA